ncbi:hypothetical protein C8D96_2788 [Kushneria marisflavi]|nr:hypothetical protein C8D96_2788 [Kushneria marisflavi]
MGLIGSVYVQPGVYKVGNEFRAINSLIHNAWLDAGADHRARTLKVLKTTNDLFLIARLKYTIAHVCIIVHPPA